MTRSGDAEFLESLLLNPHSTAPFSTTENQAVTVITCSEGTFWNADMKQRGECDDTVVKDAACD